VIGLNQPEDAVRDAFAAEAAGGIDVDDRLSLGPAYRAAAGGAGQGLPGQFPPRAHHRLVEVGESAGKTITLPGADPAQRPI